MATKKGPAGSTNSKQVKNEGSHKALYRICDFMASICLVFDVDWDEDFEDDEYVIENRRQEFVRKNGGTRCLRKYL